MTKKKQKISFKRQKKCRNNIKRVFILSVTFALEHLSIRLVVQDLGGLHKYGYSKMKKPYKYRYFKIEKLYKYNYSRTKEPYGYRCLIVKKVDGNIQDKRDF